MALSSWIIVVDAARLDRLYFYTTLGRIQRGAHGAAFSVSAFVLSVLAVFFFLLTVAQRAP